jgi:hypothetical protein
VRLTLTLRTFVLAVVLALGVLVSGAAVANASGHGHGKRALKIVATETQSEFLDLGTPGPSLGDELIISETLFRKGREVGTSGVVCTVTQAMAPYDVLTFQCLATLSLKGGQVTLHGLIEVQGEDDPGPFRVAITGGTGKFRGAGGEATVRDVGDRTIYKLFFVNQKKHRSHSGKKTH